MVHYAKVATACHALLPAHYYPTTLSKDAEKIKRGSVNGYVVQLGSFTFTSAHKRSAFNRSPKPNQYFVPLFARWHTRALYSFAKFTSPPPTSAETATLHTNAIASLFQSLPLSLPPRLGMLYFFLRSIAPASSLNSL
jgi:hypothetical protein